MMLKRWSIQIGAMAALLLVIGLILLLLVAGANLIQSVSVSALREAGWAAEHTVQAANTARTVLNVYFLLSGIVFLGFLFLMENRLVTTGIPKKCILRRTFFTVGIELLILALMQAAMMAVRRAVPLQVGLAAVEVLLGIVLVYLGRRKAPISR